MNGALVRELKTHWGLFLTNFEVCILTGFFNSSSQLTLVIREILTFVALRVTLLLT